LANHRSWNGGYSTGRVREAMICRIWRGETAPDKVDSYLEYVKATGVAAYESTPGNRGVFVLRRRFEDHVEWLTVSLWESVEAIHRFAGDDIDAPVYYPEDRDYLLSFSPRVDHYEVGFASRLSFPEAAPGRTDA
jgi:heme-degrading monooxygenase HmoA